jgi:hypothetical protein
MHHFRGVMHHSEEVLHHFALVMHHFRRVMHALPFSVITNHILSKKFSLNNKKKSPSYQDSSIKFKTGTSFSVSGLFR